MRPGLEHSNTRPLWRPPAEHVKPIGLTEERQLLDARDADYAQSVKISHIGMGDDRIDTVISHLISPYPISTSRMTISIW